MTIDFLTDYVCPFCLVTKENLVQALKMLQLEAEIIEHPYELSPVTEKQTEICDEAHRTYFARLKAPSEAVGLCMQLPPDVSPRPYTHLAFEGALLAEKKGMRARWSDRVYRAYWEQGRDIGQIAVLCEVAEEIGLNGEEMRTALEEGTWAAAVDAQTEQTLETWHPRGVPILFVDGQRIRLKAYTLEEMIQVLSGTVGTEDGEVSGCGADGCRLPR